MRTLTAQQTQVISLRDYQCCIRVLVDNGTGTATFNDLSDLQGINWLQTVKWSENMDQGVGSFTITLLRESYLKSLAPWVTGSMLNNLTGGYLPILDAFRHIKIQTAVLPLGTVPQDSDWIDSFEGRIDTVDPAKVDFQIEIDGRDLGCYPTDRVAEESLLLVPTGSEVLETCMQDDVINQIYTPPGGALDPAAPTLYVPVSPGWVLDTQGVLQPGQSCQTQLQQMAEQIGWDCRYLWNNGTEEFELTLWEPVRAGPGVAETFEPWQINDAQQGETDLSWIRNVVSVAYGQTSPPAGVVGGGAYLNPFEPVVVESPSSISQYGRRFCQIGLGATSNILDSTHATELADSVLADLEAALTTWQLDLNFRPEVMLGDYYQLNAPTPWWDTAQQFGVYGIAHEFDLPGDEGDQARAFTTLTLHGFPSGSIFDWNQATSGQQGGNAPPVKTLEPETLDYYISVAAVGATIITSVPNPNQIDWYETQAHLSTSSGFTPSAATLTDRGKKTALTLDVPGSPGTPLVPGTLYYAVLVVVDKQGNQTICPQQSFTAGKVGNVDLASDLKQNFHYHVGAAQTCGSGAGLGLFAPFFDTLDFDATNAVYNDDPDTIFVQQSIAPGTYTITAQVSLVGLPSASGASIQLFISPFGPGSPAGIHGPWISAVDDPNNVGTQTVTAQVTATFSLPIGAPGPPPTAGVFIVCITNNVPALTDLNTGGQCFFQGSFVPS